MNADTSNEIETIRGYWCESCQTGYADDNELLPMYECSTCGTCGVERRCEQCNKFAARSDAMACPGCEEEVLEETLVYDHDGTLVQVQDYDPEGESRAERETRAQEAAQRAAEQKITDEMQQILDHSQLVRWDQVFPGQRVVRSNQDGMPDVSRYFSGPDLVVDIVAFGPGAADQANRLLVLRENQYSTAPETWMVDPGDPVYLMDTPAESIAPMTRIAPQTPTMVSSPWAKVQIQLEGPEVQILGTSQLGGQRWVMCSVIGPRQARQMADVLAQLAGDGEIQAVPVLDDDRPWPVEGQRAERCEMLVLPHGDHFGIQLADHMLYIQRSSYSTGFYGLAQARGLAQALRQAADILAQRFDIR